MSKIKLPKLIIVLPCYNEQSVLKQTIPIIFTQLEELINQQIIAIDSRLLFVDDGSHDKTWTEIEELINTTKRHTNFAALKLSRNFGHQNAVYAGMRYAREHLHTDMCISMDCDLQDDPTIIPQMVAEYLAGYEIVYGVRSSRAKDSFAKRGFAELYYTILEKLRIDVIPNHADYRLLGSKALDALAQFGESNLYLRGIIPLLGYPYTKVYYERDERAAGYSKYNIHRMIRLAINGICSFSSAPLMFILWLGMFISLCSLTMAVWAIYVKLFGDGSVPGWASIVVPMTFLGGIQLFTLGVVGIYIGKIFDEVKHRPKYFIEKEIL